MPTNAKTTRKLVKPKAKKPGSRVTRKAQSKKRLELEKAKAEELARDKKFDINATGPTIEIKGEPVILPPLIEAVEGIFHTHTRREIVRTLSERYSCSVATVDRCLSVLTHEYEARAERDRAKRIAESFAQLEDIRRRAVKRDKLNAATQAIDKKHKLAGDYRPRPDLAGDRPYADLVEEAENLRKQALA